MSASLISTLKKHTSLPICGWRRSNNEGQENVSAVPHTLDHVFTVNALFVVTLEK